MNEKDIVKQIKQFSPGKKDHNFKNMIKNCKDNNGEIHSVYAFYINITRMYLLTSEGWDIPFAVMTDDSKNQIIKGLEELYEFKFENVSS